MSDERDIDDILESLDQLLRSGDHFNDDHVDPVPTPAASHKQEMMPEITEQKAAKEEAAAPAVQDELSFDENDPDFDLPLDDSDIDDTEAQTSEPIGKQRVVLTEDMMIDNPQGKLSLRVVDESEQAQSPDTPVQPDSVSEEAEPVAEETLQLDQAQIERLVSQVSEDVIAQMQQELPRMIRQSLNHHLNELMQDGGLPDSDSN